MSLLEQLAGLKHPWRAQMSSDKQAATVSAQQQPAERGNGKARPSAKARGDARGRKSPAAGPASPSPWAPEKWDRREGRGKTVPPSSAMAA